MRAMRPSCPAPTVNAVSRGAVLASLGVALTAMVALHLVQPELDPIAQPVSFYVWGRHGWLLPVALGAFGVALLALTLARPGAGGRTARPRQILGLVGTLLVLTALVPGDRWFPWEGPPTIPGLVHAGAAMLGPALLVWPMIAWAPPRDTRLRRALPWLVGVYFAGLTGSATSLGLGFLRDTPPPGIGLLERVLASAAAVWMGGFARQARAK